MSTTTSSLAPWLSAGSALEHFLSAYQNVEVGELSRLAAYVRAPHTHTPAIERLEHFKAELRHAIDNPGSLTPAIYEKWTGGAEMESQEALQEHLEEIWDACYNPAGTKVLLKDYIEGCMNPSEPRLETLAQYCKRATGGPPLERTQFFKGELRHALDHPGFVTPALYQKWSTEPMPDQAAVQRRLQEMWDKCFG